MSLKNLFHLPARSETTRRPQDLDSEEERRSLQRKLFPEFEEDEMVGDEWINVTQRRLARVLRGIVDTDPAEAARKVIEARDSLLGAAPPSEAPTPPSMRWGSLLSTSSAERKTALQGSLDAWHSGRWQLRQELGSGSSGAVFEATDMRLGRVAIKFTHSKERKKLDREAALMQKVAHERVCHLYEYYISADEQ